MLKRLLRRPYVWALDRAPDSWAIQVQARRTLGRFVDLAAGEAFNDKVHRRKLAGARFPEMALRSDKLLVKDFVRDRLGPRYVTPTLWHGTVLPPEPAADWPQGFAVKANQGSGGNVFVRDKAAADWPAIRRRAGGWLRAPHGGRHKEHWYGLIVPQLLVEPLLAEPHELRDYKVFVFHGRAAFVQVDVDRFGDRRKVLHDRDWRRLPFVIGNYPRVEEDLAPPQHFAEMLEVAEALAEGWDFVRIDLYDLPAGPRFGEMTFAPGAGYLRFSPAEYDLEVGRLWRFEDGGPRAG